jgi:hypothetical protein
MSESQKRGSRVDIQGKLRLDFHGATKNFEAGLLAYRELDSAFD